MRILTIFLLTAEKQRLSKFEISLGAKSHITLHINKKQLICLMERCILPPHNCLSFRYVCYVCNAIFNRAQSNEHEKCHPPWCRTAAMAAFNSSLGRGEFLI